MNNIYINGKNYVVQGNNITINNNSVYVDGKLVEGDLSGIVKIEFKGDLASVNSQNSISVNGSVLGNVYAEGSINCDNINGDVKAEGSVNCGKVGGSVKAGGSVNHS